MIKYLDVKIDINNLDEADSLILEKLSNWWNDSYMAESDPIEMIPFMIEQWKEKYINTQSTKEAIENINNAKPPKEIEMKLIIDLLDNSGFLKFEDDISKIPIFRPYIKAKYSKFSLDTYVYDPLKKKFESLEIIDKETLKDEEVSQQIINNFLDFHQRLLQTSSNKITLYSAQPHERIIQWYNQGFIPENTYFTNSYERAEYYFNPEENDIIEKFRIPENKMVMTSDAFGAKEYVTIDDIELE